MESSYLANAEIRDMNGEYVIVNGIIVVVITAREEASQPELGGRPVHLHHQPVRDAKEVHDMLKGHCRSGGVGNVDTALRHAKPFFARIAAIRNPQL